MTCAKLSCLANDGHTAHTHRTLTFDTCTHTDGATEPPERMHYAHTKEHSAYGKAHPFLDMGRWHRRVRP
jgi:hypothetical protein